jgi:hypothetical protein
VVGHDAANRHGVAFVAVGKESSTGGALVGGAALDLADGRFVVIAPDGDAVYDLQVSLPKTTAAVAFATAAAQTARKLGWVIRRRGR